MKNTYIITGAGKGSGRVFAIEAAKLGKNLALIARTALDLEGLKSELEKINNQIKISLHVADLSNTENTKSAFNDIEREHGKNIQALICFAGTWVKSKEINELAAQDFLEGLQANFFCTFNAIKETLHISQSELKGLTIITLGGTSSAWMNPEAPVMSVAKGAVSHYSKSLAKKLIEQEVHVAHLVIDGPVYNERGLLMTSGLSEDDYIKPESIAAEIQHVINQTKDAWTYEWDIRPFTRKNKLL